jgi:hypothetical protein
LGMGCSQARSRGERKIAGAGEAAQAEALCDASAEP